MDVTARRELRAALLAVEPWLDTTELGPRAVDAGACDRCQDLPRLLPTCGPTPWRGLCRSCAEVVGLDAWCEGHRAEGEAALAWAHELPDHWDLVATLWWIATGEVRLDVLAPLRMDQRLPRRLRAVLPAG